MFVGKSSSGYSVRSSNFFDDIQYPTVCQVMNTMNKSVFCKKLQKLPIHSEEIDRKDTKNNPIQSSKFARGLSRRAETSEIWLPK
jgi:hypothetical protein